MRAVTENRLVLANLSLLNKVNIRTSEFRPEQLEGIKEQCEQPIRCTNPDCAALLLPCSSEEINQLSK